MTLALCRSCRANDRNHWDINVIGALDALRAQSNDFCDLERAASQGTAHMQRSLPVEQIMPSGQVLPALQSRVQWGGLSSVPHVGTAVPVAGAGHVLSGAQNGVQTDCFSSPCGLWLTMQVNTSGGQLTPAENSAPQGLVSEP